MVNDECFYNILMVCMLGLLRDTFHVVVFLSSAYSITTLIGTLLQLDMQFSLPYFSVVVCS